MFLVKTRNVFFVRHLFFLFCLSNFFTHLSSWAVNKEMVEERVQELDQLNKQILKTIPDIPRYGQIDLKVKVSQINGTVSACIQKLVIGTTTIETKNTEPKCSPPQK